MTYHLCFTFGIIRDIATPLEQSFGNNFHILISQSQWQPWMHFRVLLKCYVLEIVFIDMKVIQKVGPNKRKPWIATLLCWSQKNKNQIHWHVFIEDWPLIGNGSSPYATIFDMQIFLWKTLCPPFGSMELFFISYEAKWVGFNESKPIKWYMHNLQWPWLA